MDEVRRCSVARSSRFSYLVIAAGLKELDELEHSECPFQDDESTGGSIDSDDDDDEENHRLSQSLEDINYELKKRANLKGDVYPRTELPPTNT